MKFNNGSERVRLENRWKKLRIQYREAGMSEDAIQAMYQFDLDVLNSERAYVDNTQPIFVTRMMRIPWISSGTKRLLRSLTYITKQKTVLHGSEKSKMSICLQHLKN